MNESSFIFSPRRLKSKGFQKKFHRLNPPRPKAAHSPPALYLDNITPYKLRFQPEWVNRVGLAFVANNDTIE